MSAENKAFWIAPWGRAEGFAICCGLFLVGLAIEYWLGIPHSQHFAWPINLLIIAAFSLALLMLHLFFRKWALVNWLGSRSAALASLTALLFMSLVMGLVPQNNVTGAGTATLGINSISSHPAFLLLLSLVCSCVGIATLKRLQPITLRNFAFFLNHAGLYIVLLTAIPGSADLQRLFMTLHEGGITWQASDRRGRVYDMPLAFKLLRFEMEEHNPKAVFINRKSGTVPGHQREKMFELRDGSSGQLLNWSVNVLRHHALAWPVGAAYEAVMHHGAAPASLIRVINKNDGRQLEGWISCGSFAFAEKLLQIDDELLIGMSVPSASRFRTIAHLMSKSGIDREVEIEVNRPITVDGWKIYQHSYDSRFGRWSKTSTLELIRDPWLPAVYIGFFMIIAGSLLMIFCPGHLRGHKEL